MRFGVQIPHFGPHAEPAAISELAVAAQELGFDSVWVSDHVVLPARQPSGYPFSAAGLPVANLTPFYEALTTLAFVAARTGSVGLGTSVLVVPNREPVLLAKSLATLDALSGGRLVLGVGAGWLEEEFELLGSPPFADRGRVLDEALATIEALWSGSDAVLGTRRLSPEDVVFSPRPAQRPRPPVWVGGTSAAAIRRAARRGDGWHAARLTPARLREGVALLAEACREAGRDPDRVEPSVTCLLRFGGSQIEIDRARDLVGDPETVLALARRFAAAGARTMVLGLDPLESVERRLRTIESFAREIAPELTASRVPVEVADV